MSGFPLRARTRETEAISWLQGYDPQDGYGLIGTEAENPALQVNQPVVLDAFQAGWDGAEAASGLARGGLVGVGRLVPDIAGPCLVGTANLKPATGLMADPDVVEGLMAAAGMIDATESTPVRLDGVADLVSMRFSTGDPRFDPLKPVTVNGYLYRPAKEA